MVTPFGRLCAALYGSGRVSRGWGGACPGEKSVSPAERWLCSCEGRSAYCDSPYGCGYPSRCRVGSGSVGEKVERERFRADNERSPAAPSSARGHAECSYSLGGLGNMVEPNERTTTTTGDGVERGRDEAR